MTSVASREIGSETWTKKILPNQLMWDSHNSVRLGIDEKGYIHVSGNMHVHPLAYFRSTLPYEVSSMEEVNEMTGISDDGLMVIDWETEKGESGHYTIDLETLEHSDKMAEISLRYPPDMGSHMTGIPGMSVRMAYDQLENLRDGSRYVLKWETLHGGFAQHAPEVIPEGPLSPLVLLEIN